MPQLQLQPLLTKGKYTQAVDKQENTILYVLVPFLMQHFISLQEMLTLEAPPGSEGSAGEALVLETAA